MLSSLTVLKGWVKEKFHAFVADELVSPTVLNRLQEDDALLSQALCGLNSLYHYPLIATPSFTINTTPAPNQFTLDGNTTLVVGGVFQNTANLDSLVFTLAPNTTMFLRAELASDCGDVDSYQNASGVFNDPMSRKIHLNVYLTQGALTDPAGQGGGLSSPTSMLVLMAVQGAAGTNPVITAVPNYGYAPGQSMLEHLAANPAHPAANISYDPTSSKLPSAPNRVQAALDAINSALLAKPYAELAYPHVSTSDNRTGASVAAAVAGGKVTLPGGVVLSLSEDLGGGVARKRYYTTTAWTSPDLPVNSVAYLRAQVYTDGTLLVYTALGTDADATPAGLKGTPNANSGGGFDSTCLDVLLAKIVTGAAGTTPTLTSLANAAALQGYVSNLPSCGNVISGNNDQTDTYTLNWARKPAQVYLSGIQRGYGDPSVGTDVYPGVLSRFSIQICSSYIQNYNTNVYKVMGYRAVAVA